jgi:hypothetical protein
MISARSLTNKKRRFRELRKMQSKLRSLKRGRFANRIWSKRLGNNLAVVTLLDHISEFLGCTFLHYTRKDCPVRKAVVGMQSAIARLKKECISAASSSRAVLLSAIRKFGSASTRLYHLARKCNVHWDCDESWRLCGLCVHTML